MIEGDGIICVLVYPESGEQADVWFLNMAFARTSSCARAQRVFVATAKALKDANKIGAADLSDIWEADPKIWVTPPCFTSDCVTLYENI